MQFTDSVWIESICSNVMIFTTLLMKTYEKNKAVKKEVTPEHKLEVYGY